MQRVRSFFTTLIAVILYVAFIAIIVLLALAICSFLVSVIARCLAWV